MIVTGVAYTSYVCSHLKKSYAKLQTDKLPVDLQDAEYFFVVGFQFREEFLLLQLKCDLLVGNQVRANSFHNARNREDAPQRLRHRSKPYRFSLGW
jgi:hypothetical protein